MDKYVQLIKLGDEKAFEKIFHSYFERLCYFIKDYVIELETAREIVQETFARLWEIKDTLNENSNIPALLFTIARNNALNYLKHELTKRTYRKFVTDNYNRLHINNIVLSDLIIDQLITNEVRDQINNIIYSLPERCRTAFIMSRNMGMSYKEIAEQMDISVNTVENHISEALKRIRAGLKKI